FTMGSSPLARYLSLPSWEVGWGAAGGVTGCWSGRESAASGREANRVPGGYLCRRPVEARKMWDPPETIGGAAFSLHRPPGVRTQTRRTDPEKPSSQWQNDW